MTKTLLDGVNDVLDRVGIIDANGELASLSNQGKQLFIDLAVQIWNETVDEVCNMMGPVHPAEQKATYTLALEEDNVYMGPLPDDMVQIRWPLVPTTEGDPFIYEYPGGYEEIRLLKDLPPGLPTLAALISFGRVDEGLYLQLNTTPTADDDAKTYELFYDRDLSMDEYDDVFPWSDAVYRALLPVVTEGWERRKRNDFDLEEYRKHLARAMSFVNVANRRTHW